MPTIWKKQIKITDVQEIDIPRGSTFLCVQTQTEFPCIWYFVPDTETKLKDQIQLKIFGTGNPILEDSPAEDAISDLSYLGTFQMQGGVLVWHLFGKVINYDWAEWGRPGPSAAVE